MRENFLIFGSPVIGEEEIAEVVDSLRSGWVGTGPKVQRFEAMLAEYLGGPLCRCMSSCTAALFLAMRALGIGAGDEVIVPAMTFVASANAVEHTGHGAHALGAEWRHRRVGTSGNVTAFSFYVTKNVTTIEGGALATNRSDVAAEVERLALHGLSLGAWQRFSDRGFRHYEAVSPGFKFNMTDIQASLGVHQLPRLDGWIDRRPELWERYDELLAGLPLSTPPPPEPGSRHARHLYQVRLAPDAALTRDELTTRRIGTGVHYRGVHLHPFYRDTYELRPEHFPVATDISDSTLSLPLSPKLTESDQDDVVVALTAALRR